MRHTSISELLHRNFLSVEANMPLKEVVELMHQQGKTCIVVTERDRPVGTVSERDILGLATDLMQMYPTRPTQVGDCMTSPAVCIPHDSTLYEALVITQARQIRHLPVVDPSGRLLGLISDSDIASAHLRSIERYRSHIERHIQHRTGQLEEASEALKELSLHDATLGIGNRRSMEVDMQFTHVNACKQQRGYTVALLEVDGFRRYCNDYGEEAGDAVLTQLTGCMSSVIRSSDRLYRYDASQFLLLLSETPLEQGLALAERLLDEVESLHIPHLQSEFGVTTMSAGLSELNAVQDKWQGGQEEVAPPAEWQMVVASAAYWLGQAQQQGSNCLCWKKVEAPKPESLESVAFGASLAG